VLDFAIALASTVVVPTALIAIAVRVAVATLAALTPTVFRQMTRLVALVAGSGFATVLVAVPVATVLVAILVSVLVTIAVATRLRST